MREQKKEKFIHDFNTGTKYLALKEQFKKAILRFAIEKFKKEMGAKQLSPLEKDKFKADLYVYLNEQMKAMLNQVVD